MLHITLQAICKTSNLKTYDYILNWSWSSAHFCDAKEAIIGNLVVWVWNIELAGKCWDFSSIMPITIAHVPTIFVVELAKVRLIASRSNCNPAVITSVTGYMQVVSSIAIRIPASRNSVVLNTSTSPFCTWNNHLIVKSYIIVKSIIHVHNVKVCIACRRPQDQNYQYQGNHFHFHNSHSL